MTKRPRGAPQSRRLAPENPVQGAAIYSTAYSSWGNQLIKQRSVVLLFGWGLVFIWTVMQGLVLTSVELSGKPQR
jgi:hypothetical protein